MKLRDDVATDSLGRSRSVSVDGGARELLLKLAQLPILGPKIVSPMADAMRLIDCKAPDVDLPQEPLETRHYQPLGGDEKKSHGPLADVVLVRLPLDRRERAIQLHRRHAARA